MVTEHDSNIKGSKAIIINPTFIRGSNELFHSVSRAYKIYLLCNQIQTAMRDKNDETLYKNWLICIVNMFVPSPGVTPTPSPQINVVF